MQNHPTQLLPRFLFDRRNHKINLTWTLNLKSRADCSPYSFAQSFSSDLKWKKSQIEFSFRRQSRETSQLWSLASSCVAIVCRLFFCLFFCFQVHHCSPQLLRTARPIGAFYKFLRFTAIPARFIACSSTNVHGKSSSSPSHGWTSKF